MDGGAPPLPPLLALAPVRLELAHASGGLRDAFAWPASAPDAEAAAFAARLVADGSLPPPLEAAAARCVAAAAAAWRGACAAGRQRRAAGPQLVAVRLDARAGRARLRDTFLWDTSDEGADPEAFAQRLVDDLSALPAPVAGRAPPPGDVAALGAEVALQIREACAAAWRGAPGGVAAEAAAAHAMAACGGGGEAPPDGAQWAPRLCDNEPLPPLKLPPGAEVVPPPPRPKAPNAGVKKKAAHRKAEEEDDDSDFSSEQQQGTAHKAGASKKGVKKAKVEHKTTAAPTTHAPLLPPPPVGGGAGATSALSLAQRSAAAAAQLGLGPPPPPGQSLQRLGSLHGPAGGFAVPPLQQQAQPPSAQQLQQQVNSSQFLAVLSAAFSAEERAFIVQAMQTAKGQGPEVLRQLMSKVRTEAEQRLGPGALRRPPPQ